MINPYWYQHGKLKNKNKKNNPMLQKLITLSWPLIPFHTGLQYLSLKNKARGWSRSWVICPVHAGFNPILPSKKVKSLQTFKTDKNMYFRECDSWEEAKLPGGRDLNPLILLPILISIYTFYFCFYSCFHYCSVSMDLVLKEMLKLDDQFECTEINYHPAWTHPAGWLHQQVYACALCGTMLSWNWILLCGQQFQLRGSQETWWIIHFVSAASNYLKS